MSSAYFSSFKGPRRVDLEVGVDVFTRDGERLGAVAEIAESAIRVDARLQRDYWLRSQLVRAREGDRLVVNFDRDELDQFKLDAPGAQNTKSWGQAGEETGVPATLSNQDDREPASGPAASREDRGPVDSEEVTPAGPGEVERRQRESGRPKDEIREARRK